MSCDLLVDSRAGHVEEAFFDYVRDSMLHSDPHLRPVASEVLTQPFMRYVQTYVR